MEKESKAELAYRILSKGSDGPLVLYITGCEADHKAEELYEQVKIAVGVPFVFCELCVGDWDRMLTPWPAESGLKERIFQGEGKLLLSGIEKTVIPELNEKYSCHKEIYLAGYSLAGLFSLWALYESGIFEGAVCCSGSLWYPGWKEYVMGRKFMKPVKVYLSLGKREEHTKHPVMKTVGENTRLQYELLCHDKNVSMTKLEWQTGGHFSKVAERMAMGIQWIITCKNETNRKENRYGTFDGERRI